MTWDEQITKFRADVDELEKTLPPKLSGELQPAGYAFVEWARDFANRAEAADVA